MEINVDLGVGHEGKIVHDTRLAKHAFIVGKIEPHATAFLHRMQSQLVQHLLSGKVRHIKGNHRRFRVGSAQPCRDPLGEGKVGSLVGKDISDTSCESLRVLLERVEAKQGGATVNIIGLRPSVEKSVAGGFMITAAVSVAVGVIALLKREPGAWPAFAGAVFYVLGSFTVTAACNVPLNELLATLNPTQLSSAASWSDYVRTWTAWNHVRSVACMLAFAGFTLALRATAHSEAQP